MRVLLFKLSLQTQILENTRACARTDIQCMCTLLGLLGGGECVLPAGDDVIVREQ